MDKGALLPAQGPAQVPHWVAVRTTEAGGQVLVSRSERDHAGNRREKRSSGSSRVSPTSTIFLTWWDAPGHRTPGVGQGGLDPLDIHKNSLCIFLSREQTGGSFKPLSSVRHRHHFSMDY